MPCLERQNQRSVRCDGSRTNALPGETKNQNLPKDQYGVTDQCPAWRDRTKDQYGVTDQCPAWRDRTKDQYGVTDQCPAWRDRTKDQYGVTDQCPAWRDRTKDQYGVTGHGPMPCLERQNQRSVRCDGSRTNALPGETQLTSVWCLADHKHLQRPLVQTGRVVQGTEDRQHRILLIVNNIVGQQRSTVVRASHS